MLALVHLSLAQVADVSPDFQNQTYMSLGAPGQSLPGTTGISIFGGHVGRPGDARTPASGPIFLVRSAFGQAVAPLHGPAEFLCGEESQYHVWMQGHFPGSDYYDPARASALWGIEADADRDGYDNLFEFATGSDPLRAETVFPVQAGIEVIGGFQYPTATVRQRIDDPSLIFSASVSSNLQAWDTSASAIEIASTRSAGPGFIEVTYRGRVPVESPGARFLRVKVTYQNDTPPSVAITSPSSPLTTNGRVALVLSDAIPITASAQERDGCVIALEYFANGQFIGRILNGDGSLAWRPNATGPYDIVVRAVDNYGAATVSAPLGVIIDRDSDGDGIPDNLDPRPGVRNEPPRIQSLAVTSPDNFHLPGRVVVDVVRFDADGDPSLVELRADAVAVLPFQNSGRLVWQTGVSGRTTLLTVSTRDPWGATDARSAPVYLFRKPPTP